MIFIYLIANEGEHLFASIGYFYFFCELTVYIFRLYFNGPFTFFKGAIHFLTIDLKKKSTLYIKDNILANTYISAFITKHCSKNLQYLLI